MRLLYLLWALTDEFSFLANAKANAKVSVLNSVNALASSKMSRIFAVS